MFADSLTGSDDDNRIAPLLAGIGIDDIDGLGGIDTLELRLGGQTAGLVFNQVAD